MQKVVPVVFYCRASLHKPPMLMPQMEEEENLF